MFAAGGSRLMIPRPSLRGTNISFLIFGLGPVFCHDTLGEPGTRRRGTSAKHLDFIYKTQRSRETHYPHKMMLRMDPEAGKHRAYKGETKLDKNNSVIFYLKISNSLLYLSKFFKYLYFTGVVLF